MNKNQSYRALLLGAFFLLESCSPKIQIHPYTKLDGEISNIEDISDSYFLSTKGFTKITAVKKMEELLHQIADKNRYGYYYELSSGEIKGSFLYPKIKIIKRVKYFRTEEESIKFSQTYNPFGQN
tara:strand:+ start:369 stop:743 length:375 start_codon:yes stop_codon:yes gene_type:complete